MSCTQINRENIERKVKSRNVYNLLFQGTDEKTRVELVAAAVNTRN
jgi:hypothetical protein